MHVMRGRRKIAECHGAGHAGVLQRLCGSWPTRAFHGVRRVKPPRTTCSAPKDQCPADLVKRHFEAFAPDDLWDADIT